MRKVVKIRNNFCQLRYFLASMIPGYPIISMSAYNQQFQGFYPDRYWDNCAAQRICTKFIFRFYRLSLVSRLSVHYVLITVYAVMRIANQDFFQRKDRVPCSETFMREPELYDGTGWRGPERGILAWTVLWQFCTSSVE